jgi:hypothetical protein
MIVKYDLQSQLQWGKNICLKVPTLFKVEISDGGIWEIKNVVGSADAI